MKKIPLTQGKFAIVDDEDYERVIAFGKWHASVHKDKNTIYAARTNEGKTILMHRIILNLTNPDILVDHHNCDGLDNRRMNLRISTKKENNRNVTIRKNNSSGHKGVHWDKKKMKWRARIQSDGRRIDIGVFDSVIEAAAEYNRFAIKHHGEFANLNKI